MLAPPNTVTKFLYWQFPNIAPTLFCFLLAAILKTFHCRCWRLYHTRPAFEASSQSPFRTRRDISDHRAVGPPSLVTQTAHCNNSTHWNSIHNLTILLVCHTFFESPHIQCTAYVRNRLGFRKKKYRFLPFSWIPNLTDQWEIWLQNLSKQKYLQPLKCS